MVFLRFLRIAAVGAGMALVSALVVGGSQPGHATIIQGCDQSIANISDVNFPSQALGNYPDRIANWEVAFQRGRYNLRIASRHDFEPFIFKKVGGKYVYAGRHRNASFQNDRNGNPFFYYDMPINSEGIDTNWWLFQVKPERSAQNTRHIVRLIIKGACKRPVNNNNNDDGPKCPPGYYADDSSNLFGQYTCKKK